jgi:DNA processing protein
LHISLLHGIGPATIQLLLERAPEGFSFDDVYTLSKNEWKYIFSVSENIAQKLVAGLQDKSLLENELSLIEKHKVLWMSCKNDAYPKLLREIHSPPTILYWYGATPTSEKTIAIIGARKANEYAQRAIDCFVTDLVAHDFIVVSGGAIGADSMAHSKTVDLNGKTIAVLGSGLLHPYPASNRTLFNAIIKNGGTVLSIFPMDTLPQPGNFPARNRVIAGLSRGCIVAQAARKSGARITAQFALEQGRDVFAVPGDIFDPLSAGCHELIKEGATVVSSAADIFSEWAYEVEDQNVQQELFVKTKKEVVIDREEELLLHICSRPSSFDDIVFQSKISAEILQDRLFELRLAGKLEQDFTGMWVKK